MIGLWPNFYHHVDDLDYEANLSVASSGINGGEQSGLYGCKRQRRSIFFTAAEESDSDDDCPGGLLGHMKSGNVHVKLAVVPATPYAANPLSKGACALTPNFPRRSSSPCLDMSKAFVATHEEPNSHYRSYMEDRTATMTADGVAYLGVFDGHGGVDASTFLQRHLLNTIQAHLQPGCDVHDALTAAYSATNAAFRATGSIQGSTATTVILQKGRLIAANVGDSPAFVVMKCGKVYSIINEHKIEGAEAARITAHGAPIYRSPTGPAYMGTPDGTRWLNMSRAFGDFVYPAISCEPHVCSLDVSDGHYLIMGSDGLTEKWSVAEAAQYVTQLAAEKCSIENICRLMVERSLARGSTDNISCMVVDLEAYMLHVEAADAGLEVELEEPAACEATVRTMQQLAGGVEDGREEGLGSECVVLRAAPADDGDLGQCGVAGFGPSVSYEDDDDEEIGSSPEMSRHGSGADNQQNRDQAGQPWRRDSSSASPGSGKRRRGTEGGAGESGVGPAKIEDEEETAAACLQQLLCEETPATSPTRGEEDQQQRRRGPSDGSPQSCQRQLSPRCHTEEQAAAAALLSAARCCAALGAGADGLHRGGDAASEAAASCSSAQAAGPDGCLAQAGDGEQQHQLGVSSACAVSDVGQSPVAASGVHGGEQPLAAVPVEAAGLGPASSSRSECKVQAAGNPAVEAAQELQTSEERLDKPQCDAAQLAEACAAEPLSGTTSDVTEPTLAVAL